jgi:RNA polymerase sigma-B factor
MTAELIRRARDPRCPRLERNRLRDRAVALNLPLAEGLAGRYRHRGEDVEDLTQVAALALVKAVRRYDPARGRAFVGYAAPTILGELKRHFRDRVWSVHVPRRLQERCLAVTRGRADLTAVLGRPPSAAEIAGHLGVTEVEVHATEASQSAYRADSLNRQTGADSQGSERQDLLGAEDPDLVAVCDREALRAAVDRLPPREKYVVEHYFYARRTQADVASDLGTSQMSVSRTLSRAVAALRDLLLLQPDGDSERPVPAGGEPTAPVVRAGPRGHVVVAVRGDLDDAGAAARLRDALVDVAVVRRPRALVVDLRRVSRLGPSAVRALVDGHRACGHVGAALCAVNIPHEAYDVLRQRSVVRLFTCRPLVPPRPRPPAPRAAGPERGDLPSDHGPLRLPAVSRENGPVRSRTAPATGGGRPARSPVGYRRGRTGHAARPPRVVGPGQTRRRPTRVVGRGPPCPP